MQSRSALTVLPLVLALVTFGAGSRVGAQQQSTTQQRCITGVNAATRNVARAQGKSNGLCLKVPNPATIESCLSGDPKGLVEKALTKLENAVASKCTTPPDFGVTSAAAAGASASGHDIGLFRDLFGDLSQAMSNGASDPSVAVCQRGGQKAYESMFQAQLKEFALCKKERLASGAITSRASLAECLDVMRTDARFRIGRKQAKLFDVFDRCGTPARQAAFPGRCLSPYVSNCFQIVSLCRACLLLSQADDLDASCDLVDDGVANVSCGCGNGVVEPGEECDDGNFFEGDCCSSGCTVEPAHPCTDDRNACTDDQCDGGGTCAHPLLPICDGVTLHEHVAASNLVVVYTKTFVPNAPGGFEEQHPLDKRSIETVVRVDPTVDFNYGFDTGPPGTFFYPYMYSIRWVGGLEAPSTGSYAFEVTTGHDGVGRLYVDGGLVAEKTAFNTDPVTAAVVLTAGRHEIRFDYINYFYGGVVRLQWQPPGEGSPAPIPAESLYPVVDGATSGGLTGTYYATPLFIDKLEQLRKFYRDMRRWIWINSDLQLDTEFDVRVIDAPLNLSRFDEGFMGPFFIDEEGRSVSSDIVALGIDRHAFASLAAWSPPLLRPDSLGNVGNRTGFFAAGATMGGTQPTYSSIQTNIIPADVVEFGLRVFNWFGDPPIVQYDIYPNNHAFAFIAATPAGFGDSSLFPYNAISYRRLGLQDWEMLLVKPGFYAGITPDSDGDGIPDGGTEVPVNEADFGSDPFSADTDLDGLSDFAELTRGFSQPTDPLEADTDGDGTPDADDKHPRFAIEESILSSTPVRDGTIGVGEYGSPFVAVGDPDDPSDFSATIWVTWNAAGLNVAIKVVDESIDPPDFTYPQAFSEGGDNVRVRLDLASDGFLSNPSSLYSDNLEIAVAPSDAADSPNRFVALHRLAPEGYVVDYDMVPESSIPTYYQLTPDGYVVELLVPANAALGFTPAACRPFALQVQVHDRDLRQTSEQLIYQVLREGAVALVHHQDYQADFPTGFGTGGLGAFASLVMADTLGQDCNHAPTVEAVADQTVTIGEPLQRLFITARDDDRDRLTLSATVDGGQPLSTIGATFEDRGVNLGILRWDPASPADHLVTVTATDPQGMTGQSSFTISGEP